ncbi:hypothetical protein OHA72_35315 [Dactylosporangium sp. NBC_01737]|uniref:hypothetical protein n=1 Tax=Dactylosporangium sp. NBC_01737 TaxID=2975959 RepID=UPI002E1165C0|nr:hypothetical protein OHA72_35315 [Dactylosporangium sp. NBC_01737]
MGAAALLDMPLPDAQDLLDELADAQLVETSASSRGESTRYRLHDLIRVFARERLLQDEPAAARDAALARYMGALLLLAGAAHDAMYGGDFLRFRSQTVLYPLPPFTAASDLPAVTNGVLAAGSLLGGLLVPVVLFPASLADLAKALPTYWLGEVGRGAADGHTGVRDAALVLAAWTIEAALVLAVRHWRTAQSRPDR